MSTRYQAFKEELEQLVFLILKLVLHWLALVVILAFVLVGFWLHHLFRKVYVQLEQKETVEAESNKARQSADSHSQCNENRRRTRRNRRRNSAQEPPARKPAPTRLKAENPRTSSDPVEASAAGSQKGNARGLPRRAAGPARPAPCAFFVEQRC